MNVVFLILKRNVTPSAYQPWFLRELVKVYIALHALEPRPSLDRSVAIIVNSFTGKKTNYEVLYRDLLAPLIIAVSVLLLFL